MRIAVCDDNKKYADQIYDAVVSLLNTEKIEFDIDLYYDSESIFNCGVYYDLAFLDIEMSPYSGIQVAKILKNTNPYIIIFIITSYNRYLDDAMDLNVFRYIQKPIDLTRLRAGIIKALDNIDNNVITFNVKHGSKAVSLISNDIIFIEIAGRSTKVFTVNGEYISDNKMDFWQSKLIASFFYRVHKSFIINLKFVTKYQRDSVVLCQKYKIPVAYRKQAQFRKFFFDYLGGR